MQSSSIPTSSTTAAAASTSSDPLLFAINPRVAALKPSKTMALTDKARELKEAGKDVIGLAAGEPDFDTPAAIVDAGVEALRTGITRYTPNAGTPALRYAIAAKLRRENRLVDIAAGDVVVSNGAKQSIWQALLATCAEGDEVVIPAPFWVSYPEMARMAGATPVVVRSTASEGFLLSAGALEGALTPRSRLLILCTPSNPSGAVYPRGRLEELAAVVARHPRLLVLSDEIYEYICYPTAEHVAFGSLPGMKERTLTVNGFSKAYAMTGWRLGYLAAPRPFSSACSAIQSQSTSGASSIAQHAAVAALTKLGGERGGEPVAEMVRAFRERRDYVCSRLRAIPGVSLPSTPDGAFYALPDVSALVGEGAVGVSGGFGPVADGDALCSYLLQEALVALVPGEAFGAPECVRLSYAASMGTLKEALDRIEGALSEERYQRPPAARK